MTVRADQPDAGATRATPGAASAPIVRLAVESWRPEPVPLIGPRVLLRELQPKDAPLLWYHVRSANHDDAVGCMPANVPDFERFIAWARAERTRGRLLTYCAVDRDTRTPVGMFQAWPRTADGLVAEWGFGIGCAYWGTGFFEEAAVLLVDDLFAARHVERLEALTTDRNLRGSAALRKLGARRDGVDPASDSTVWTLLVEEWRLRRGPAYPGSGLCLVRAERKR